jgi:hypothetical protein
LQIKPRGTLDLLLMVGLALGLTARDVHAPRDSPPQTFELLEVLRDNKTFSEAANQSPSAPYEVLTTEIGQVLQGGTSLDRVQQEMQEAAVEAES